MTPNPRLGFGVLLCAAGRAGGSLGRPGWASGGLVVAVWVEKQFAEQFAGGGVDDADVQVLDQEQDVGSGVVSADADVVEFSAVAEGDDAGVVDAVAADTVVGAGGAVAGGGLGPGGVGGGRGGPVGQGPVRPFFVVDGGELIELGLEPGEGGGGRLPGQPFLEGLLEPLDLALGLGSGSACRSSG
jgi:hypothetical protein